MEIQDEQNSYYSLPMPNGNVILSQEQVQLHIGNSDYEGSALALFQLLPVPKVFISIELGIAELETKLKLVKGIKDSDIVSTTFQETKITTDVLITGMNFSTNEPLHVKGVLRNGIAHSNHVNNLQAVTFYLCNFRDFHVHEPSGHSVGFELFCQASGWELKVAPVENLRDQIKNLQETGGYGFTHICRLKKTDNSKFSSQETSDYLTALFYFFSFARGSWCPTVLPVGYDENSEAIWFEWGARMTDRWSDNGLSWFDSHHAEVLPEILPGFLKLWEDDLWQSPLRSAVYWYIGSNKKAAGIDGGLILSQAALEKLSSVYNVSSNAPVERTQASKKIRRLLDELAIPVDIPKEMTNLISSKGHKNKDAPEIIAEIRNSITHQNRLVFRDALYEAWNLNLWYIEMVLLRLFEFTGHYGNRLTRGWLGQVVPVPWASEE